MTIAGGEKAVVTDLVKTAGEDMLQETADELHHRQGHRLPYLFPGILVAEGNLAVISGKDAIVGDGDAVDVTGEILEDFLCSLDTGLTVNDPFDLPQGFGEADLRQGPASQIYELSPKDA